ncbi:MAG: LUD domain-containing protein [Bacteroidota bacterium]|nr:LUD domain-containing protein [Bacteroidota bacterium]
MEETTSKEKMLKSIRNALIHKSIHPYPGVDLESSVYAHSNDTLDLTFAEEFTKANGQFVYCEDVMALVDNLKIMAHEKKWTNIFSFDNQLSKVLEAAEIVHSSKDEDFESLKVAVTFCESLIARLGSILISSRQTAGRRLNIYPEIHVVVAMSSQIMPDIRDAMKTIREKYSGRLPSLISLITGPSRTAGIEASLVPGGQGPREVFVFLVDDTPMKSNDEQ